MFFIELKETEEAEEDDEINKSIKEIHQSAQKLSDNIEKLSGPREKLSDSSNKGLISSTMSSHPEHVDAILVVSEGETPNFDCQIRSSTLKSTFTDYDTPPETPELNLDRLKIIYNNINNMK